MVMAGEWARGGNPTGSLAVAQESSRGRRRLGIYSLGRTGESREGQPGTFPGEAKPPARGERRPPIQRAETRRPSWVFFSSFFGACYLFVVLEEDTLRRRATGGACSRPVGLGRVALDAGPARLDGGDATLANRTVGVGE